MNDEKISTMYQLESVIEILTEAERLEMDDCDLMHLPTADFEELCSRVWAALYMVQAMNGGNKPANYGEVMDKVLEHDSRIQMRMVIDDAKNGGFED